jgi:hypothetical protein
MKVILETRRAHYIRCQIFLKPKKLEYAFAEVNGIIRLTKMNGGTFLAQWTTVPLIESAFSVTLYYANIIDWFLVQILWSSRSI